MTIIVTTNLDSIDTVPIHSDELSTELTQWLTALVDNLNYTILQIQNFLNQPQAAPLTSTQIAAVSSSWPNGVLFFDTTNNVYVGKISGSLVKFTTAAYP